MRPLEKTKVESMLTQVTWHAREFRHLNDNMTDVGLCDVFDARM
jgi:hypothetical protein